MKRRQKLRPKSVRLRLLEAGDWKSLERRYNRQVQIRNSAFFNTVMNSLPHEDELTVYYVVNPDDPTWTLKIRIRKDGYRGNPTVSSSHELSVKLVEELIEGKNKEQFVHVKGDTAKKIWLSIRRDKRANKVASAYYKTLCDLLHSMYDEGSYGGLSILIENDDRQYVLVYERPWLFELHRVNKKLT